MNVRSGLGAALGAMLALFASSAQAQQGGWRPKAQGHRVFFQTDLWPTSDFIVATMGIGAQIAVHENVGLDFDIPWAFGGGNLPPWIVAGGDKGNATFGNPTLGAHFTTMLTPDVAFSIGETISIPTRWKVGRAVDTFLFSGVAASSRAYFDYHRLIPAALTLRIPIGLEARFARILYYRGELTPEILIPVGDDLLAGKVKVVLEHADEIEARAPFGFGGGFRFQFAFALADGVFAGNDQAQVALEPFIGYEPKEDGLFLRFGFLVALDKPLGFGIDKDKLAALRLQIGGKF